MCKKNFKTKITDRFFVKTHLKKKKGESAVCLKVLDHALLTKKDQENMAGT